MPKRKLPAALKANQFKKGHIGGAAHPKYKPSLHKKAGAKRASGKKSRMPAGLAKYLAAKKKKQKGG